MFQVVSTSPRAIRASANDTDRLYGVRPPSGGGMMVSMSWLFITASQCNDSTRGRASPDGIGVTKPTHSAAMRGVSTGSTRIRRGRSPATSA